MCELVEERHGGENTGMSRNDSILSRWVQFSGDNPLLTVKRLLALQTSQANLTNDAFLMGRKTDDLRLGGV